MNRVGLIDSGLCNMGSARRALEECGATVTSSQVLAADGTPKIDAKPEGC